MDYNHEDQGETFDKATGEPVGPKPAKPILVETRYGAVELVQTNAGREQEFVRKRWRPSPTVVKMKEYDVLLEGQKIGEVAQALATFERRTRGRTYVNSRWHNVRWFYELDKDPAFRTKYGERRSTDYETRKRCVEALMDIRAHRLRTAAEADPSIEFIDV
jgi:hypothetical protein